MKEDIFGGIGLMCFIKGTFGAGLEELYDNFPLPYCLFWLNKMQSYNDLTFNFSFMKWLWLSPLCCEAKRVSGA